MKIERVASIPLIVSDPYFSVWSKTDKLYDGDTVHWAKMRQKIRGYISIDGTVYCFMGDKEFHEVIEQKYVDVTATATEYYFENDKAGLKLTFVSPTLGNDMLLVSRPCTYIDFEVDNKAAKDIKITMVYSDDLVTTDRDSLIIGDDYVRKAVDKLPEFKYSFMGRAYQKPLGNSGDNIGIDWGYFYAASSDKNVEISFDASNSQIQVDFDMSKESKAGMIAAYDDVLSINYFGQWRKAYWTEVYGDILTAIGAAFADKKETLKKAKEVDKDIYNRAFKAYGEDYALICTMAYRHAFVAHKLIKDEEDNFIFLSKENDSNGCIGTVDISYPSAPLFLLYNTEYVKGMLRPVYKFAACEVWNFDFAPHDVGRYPYADGQVYGLNPKKWDKAYCGLKEAIYPPFYMYPKENDIYDIKYQMPVEECGNMLILTALVCEKDQSAEFAKPYMDIIDKWAKYLIEYGENPGEQLCTDDFAGHLSGNVNLSAKAIMGLEAYSKLLNMLGNQDKSREYHNIAKQMAGSLEKRALDGNHYSLAYGKQDTWSLKYNIVWDKYFESQLFSNSLFEKEAAYYMTKINEFGIPLDNRRDYTKSDWIMWCVAFIDDKEKAARLIEPVANYLKNTKTRVPFSDWYDTVTGEYVAFIARSVQGGLFMPILMNER